MWCEAVRGGNSVLLGWATVCLAGLAAACGGSAPPSAPTRLAATHVRVGVAGVLTNADLATRTLTVTVLVRNEAAGPITLATPRWSGGARTRARRAGFVPARLAQATIEGPGRSTLTGSTPLRAGQSVGVVYLLSAMCRRSGGAAVRRDAASISVRGRSGPVVLGLGSHGRALVNAAYAAQCERPNSSGR